MEFDFPQTTMYRCIYDNNISHLNRIAIEYFGREVTYGELFKNIDITAESLVALGIKKGDIITIAMPTTPETVYLLYAISKLGAVANMIDPRTSKEGIYNYTKEADSKIFIAIDLCYGQIKDISEHTSVEKIILISAGDSLNGLKRKAYKISEHLDCVRRKRVRIHYNDSILKWNEFFDLGRNGTKKAEENKEKGLPVAILHTGGTTGIPKGVVLSNECFNTIAYQYKLSGMHLIAGQRFLDIMPPFIAYGVGAGLHMPFVVGMTSVLVPKFEPRKFASMIKKLKPNHMAVVPSYWGDVLRSKELKKENMTYLITPAVGGDAMNLELEKQANEFLNVHNAPNSIIKGYGITEQCSLAAACINDINEMGSVGIPLPQNVISVFDTETGEELKYNQRGEVCISGPTIMLGYHKNKEATDALIHIHKDGRRWIHTGDLGYMTEKGMLYIDGRIKRMIIRNDGFKVFPSFIEGVVNKNENVKECCSVGINDEHYAQGMLPVVYVVLKDKLTKTKGQIIEDIYDLCREELPEYSQPKEIYLIDKLPLTPIGKIDYRELENRAIIN